MTAPAPPVLEHGLSDAALARVLAGRSGDLLLALRSSGAGLPPAELRDRGDRSSHDALMAALSVARPLDVVLSEEAADDGARLRADRVWIIDPLDGTREFGELDRSDWAVHVALWERGELVAGAVGLPALGIVLATDDPPVVPPAQLGPPRLAVSRTRPPAFVELLVERLGVVPVPMGSAGAKAAAVIRGEVDLYVHAGGQYQWDSAAPVAVARAAGLFTSRVDGSALVYNLADLSVPDLVVARPELADDVLAVLAEADL